jgi:hypothetical protein
MNDRNLSATVVAATVLWILGGSLAVVEAVSGLQVGALGIVAVAGGATLNVRGYFCGLEARERNAFVLGRDYEREQERGMRSV